MNTRTGIKNWLIDHRLPILAIAMTAWLALAMYLQVETQSEIVRNFNHDGFTTYYWHSKGNWPEFLPVIGIYAQSRAMLEQDSPGGRLVLASESRRLQFALAADLLLAALTVPMGILVKLERRRREDEPGQQEVDPVSGKDRPGSEEQPLC